MTTSFHPRPVALASSTATMSVAPSLLVAATAVQISADLHLDIGQVGLAVSGFYGATAATTATLGKVVSRHGPRRSLVAVMAFNATVLVILGLAQNIWIIAAALLVGGVANGAVHPASNVVLAQGVRGHLGLALGIKQSSMPAAGLAGGLAVPAIALTVGWRWAFAVAAVVSCALMIAAFCYRPVADVDGRPRPQPVGGGATDGPAFPLRLLSVGVLCGAAAGTSLTVFLISGAVASDMLAPATAGLLAAVCGALAVLARIGLGWRADRRPDRNPSVNAFVLLFTCSVGGCLMAVGSPTLFIIGATLAAGLGFGWTGLVHLATMRAHADDPARATGTLMTGFAGGSFLGPLVLAQVASHWGYRPVWISIAVLALVSAMALAAVTRSRRAHHPATAVDDSPHRLKGADT